MIRSATFNDIAIIQSIAKTTWPIAYGDIISKDQLDYMLNLMYSDDSLKKQIEKGHQFYLFYLTDTPIAFASVSNEGENIFKLNKLYVLPSTQKTGAGKALLQKVIEHAKSENGKQIILQVNKLNIAKEFYLKHGFTVLREDVLELEHGYVMDDYIMGLNI
ncbi:MAG: N-acetyltransferase [Sphingobacteriia bacterium]|nr:MAG: N-acetyltransferase [Sphingobacteriia bacterium]